MSVTSGAAALKPCSIGGRSAASAGSAGMSITLTIFQSPGPPFPAWSRYHIQMDDERSSSEITTPTKP
jgi:hypothetical protein